MFVVPKTGGGWRLIIDLRYLNSFLESPHFQDGRSLYVTKHRKLRCFMVKIDLKDAYLTIPIARNFQLSRQYHKRWCSFNVYPSDSALHHSFFKKPITQFLHQLGINLIIYFDDLMLAAPLEVQLLQNLSTVLWLFYCPGFHYKHPKSVTVPTQCLEFLGFMINTQTMTVILSQQNCI